MTTRKRRTNFDSRKYFLKSHQMELMRSTNKDEKFTEKHAQNRIFFLHVKDGTISTCVKEKMPLAIAQKQKKKSETPKEKKSSKHSNYFGQKIVLHRLLNSFLASVLGSLLQGLKNHSKSGEETPHTRPKIVSSSSSSSPLHFMPTLSQAC